MSFVASRSRKPVSYVAHQVFCLRFKEPIDNVDDAWELCLAMNHRGGVEIGNGCYAFADEDQRVTAIEYLRERFGTSYVSRHFSLDTL